MEKLKSNLWIDVRSPIEYQQGHRPGAVNVPLFSDEERARIGTIYKQKSPWEAIQKGMEIAIPKSTMIVDSIRPLCTDNSCTLYCWRGGMRSQAVAELLRDAGIIVHLLEGGYKAYRRQNEALFSRPMNIRLLGGLTGTGKTERLQELKSAGEQVLDLEDLANHRGSCFGHIGQQKQPTTEHFHNLIAHELYDIDPDKILWIEDEGRILGSCHLPEPLYKQMRNAPIEILSCSMEERLERLNRAYGNADPQEWIKAIYYLKKKLGSKNAQQAIHYIHSGRLKDAAMIVLSHYDKTYQLNLNNRSNSEKIN